MVSAMLLCSCLSVEDGSGGYVSGDSRFPIKVYVSQPELVSGVRSSFSATEMNRLTDLNIFVYHQGQLLTEHSGYYDDVSSLMLSFPVGKDGFNIYMLGNVGRLDPPMAEEQIGGMRYVVGDYEEFRTRGVPVAGVFKEFYRGTLADFPLQRLVGQFDIRMKQSADKASYLIKDIRVMNCALDVYPFAENAKASLFARSYQYDQRCLGDMLTDEDVELLNCGGVVSLYFVENLQGELLPDNTDQSAKIPSSLPDGVADCCTYIEITADVTTQMAHYTDNRYRFYPGGNETSDFSIRRNTLYRVELDFTQNMISEQEWRIEAQEPDVVMVWMDKQEAMVIKGAEDMILVRSLDNNGNFLDFDVGTLTSSGYVNVSKEVVQHGGVDFLALKFTSNVDLAGLYPVGSEPVYLTETVRLTSRETYNGVPLYSKDIPVRVYYKLFPLHVSLEKRTDSGPYSIALRGRNPMGLGLSVSSTYVYGGQSLSTTRKYALNLEYGDVGNVTVQENAVGLAPVYLGDLASGVQYDNLTRLNLSISGASDATVDGSGFRLRYPKLQNESLLYTGEYTEASFGPTSELRPYIGAAFADDATCTFDYEIGGASYNVSITSEKSASVSVQDMMTLCICNKGKAYLNTGNGHCVGYARVTGVGSVAFNEIYMDEYEGFPFYVANGAMVCSSTSVVPSGAIGNWNNKTTRGVTMQFLGPGRDLFRQTKELSVTSNSKHVLEFYVQIWKNLLGNIKTQQYVRRYTGGSYLTVNGATTWLGGDTSAYGVPADEI